MLFSESDAKAICTKALSFTKADDACVRLSGDAHCNLRFAGGSFTTNGYREDAELSVTVWVAGRKGSASSNELDDASLRATVAQAEELAKVSPVDEEYVPTLGAESYKPAGGFVEETLRLSLDARARSVAGIIDDCQKAGAVAAGFHQTRGSFAAGATQHGNFHYDRSTLVSLSVTARTLEGAGSGYFLRNHFDVARLDVARIGGEAIQKALRSRQPQALQAGTYTVILEPQAVADLLGYSRAEFDARQADEGRSVFSAPGGKTRLGERVFDERLSFYTDPWHPDLPGPRAAQDGIPAEKFFLVRNGVLEKLIYSRFWGRKKNQPATPGPVNMILASSAPPVGIEDMVRGTRRGLLVSRFWYLRTVDPRTASLTGLTRDGVWLIENGKIAHPVRNFRFNQSTVQMLAPGNVDLIGAPERVSSSESQGANALLLPALKVKEFHFTAASDAV
jgi:predicted Zn-dependent protease